MDILNIILIVSILIIGYFVVQKFFGPNTKETKPTHLKKEEIIEMYVQQMREVLDTHRSNNEQQKLKKMQTLKQISAELSTNIFFDKDEVKDILQKLANMH